MYSSNSFRIELTFFGLIYYKIALVMNKLVNLKFEVVNYVIFSILFISFISFISPGIMYTKSD